MFAAVPGAAAGDRLGLVGWTGAELIMIAIVFGEVLPQWLERR